MNEICVPTTRAIITDLYIIMKIYHYTSIETLALILKHKTIRFNRLDRMDDPCEKNFIINQMNWSPYTYVSCWTENPAESIPQWHIYTDGGIGVRIGLDKDFIDWDKQLTAFSVPSHQRHHKGSAKDSTGAISVMFNPTRIYRPLSTEVCYNRVTYASEKEYENFEREIGEVSPFIDIDEKTMRKYVGYYRKDKWAFQEESRFVLYAVPFSPTDAVISHSDFINLIRVNSPNNVHFIDVPLKSDKLKKIEVVLGPNVDEGQTILVKALLQKFAPEAELKVSKLNDTPLWFLM